MKTLMTALMFVAMTLTVVGCDAEDTSQPQTQKQVDYPNCGDLGEQCCVVEGSDPCAYSLKCVAVENGAKCVPDGWK